MSCEFFFFQFWPFIIPSWSFYKVIVCSWHCFLLMDVMWCESHSVVSSFLWPYWLYSPWNSPGQNTGVGSLSLLQGIFPTQGSNPSLPPCRQILYQLIYIAYKCFSYIWFCFNPFKSVPGRKFEDCLWNDHLYYSRLYSIIILCVYKCVCERETERENEQIWLWHVLPHMTISSGLDCFLFSLPLSSLLWQHSFK